jgi:electron transfer flavoprotein beta subunit
MVDSAEDSATRHPTAMNVLVCVKRVPQTGGRIVLTPDGQAIDTRFLGFTISPHEECGVEEAVRIVEREGGSSAVLTLGPTEAEDQLRDAMALGIERAILLETDGTEWDPVSTAAAIAETIRTQEAANGAFDLVIFGNEAADTGDFQVGIRVAVALGRPIVNGVKGLDLRDGAAVARREAPGGGWETYELRLPAVVGVKEGLNLPRYPSVPGRLRAKKKEVERVAVGGTPANPEGAMPGPTKLGLRLPAEERTAAAVIGHGIDAAPAVVDLLEKIGVLS